MTRLSAILMWLRWGQLTCALLIIAAVAGALTLSVAVYPQMPTLEPIPGAPASQYGNISSLRPVGMLHLMHSRFPNFLCMMPLVWHLACLLAEAALLTAVTCALLRTILPTDDAVADAAAVVPDRDNACKGRRFARRRLVNLLNALPFSLAIALLPPLLVLTYSAVGPPWAGYLSAFLLVAGLLLLLDSRHGSTLNPDLIGWDGGLRCDASSNGQTPALVLATLALLLGMLCFLLAWREAILGSGFSHFSALARNIGTGGNITQATRDLDWNYLTWDGDGRFFSGLRVISDMLLPAGAAFAAASLGLGFGPISKLVSSSPGLGSRLTVFKCLDFWAVALSLLTAVAWLLFLRSWLYWGMPPTLWRTAWAFSQGLLMMLAVFLVCRAWSIRIAVV